MSQAQPEVLDDALAVDAGRGRAARWAVLASFALHLALGALLVIGPFPASRPELPGVVTVDLLASAPASPVPSAPAPEPAAPPRAAQPPPPRPPQTVLPEAPRRAPEPKAPPEPEARAPDPPAPAPEPVPEAPAYEDVLAQLRAERDEVRHEPQRAERPGLPGLAGRSGSPVAPEVAAWIRQARLAVRRAWVRAPGFGRERLETHVSVDLGAAGEVRGEPRITRRSGNPWFDDSVVRAIQKASPLPAPPSPGEWPFVFRPEDAL